MAYTATISLTVPVAREASGPPLSTPDELARQCLDMRDLGQEVFAVLTLNQKNAVIDRHIVAVGTLTESLVHPRDVFRAAVSDNAAAVAIVLVHNHPSGDSTPSRADRNLTQRMKEAADLLAIRLIDHLVIGRNSWASIMTDERGSL